MPGGIITTGNHPKLLWPGIKAIFGRQYDEHQVEYTDLFDMESSRQNYEEDVLITGFGIAGQKSEGGSIRYDAETQGYIARYINVAYGSGYIVTREELDDDLYEAVSKRRAQALAFAMRQTKELVAANVYNNAFSTSYAMGDGAAILSTAHPTLTGNQANILTVAADISETAIEDMIIAIMGARNDKGLYISLMPQSLIVSRQQWFDANRIMKSILQNDTMNNAVNVLKATNAIPGGIKVNHYLTDPDAWFIRTNAPRGCIGYQRVELEFSQDNDFDTMNLKAKAYERYSFGVTDWRGLFGSPGA